MLQAQYCVMCVGESNRPRVHAPVRMARCNGHWHDLRRGIGRGSVNYPAHP
jgi:hypothetical protein